MTDKMLSSSPPQAHDQVFHIILVYAVISALWILLSDQWVGWLLQDPQQITLVSTFKGWLFVFVSSLLLYGLLRKPSSDNPPLEHRRLGIMPKLVMGGIVVAMGASIAHTTLHQRANAFSQLHIIADLKSRQITDWLRERRSTAALVRSSQLLADYYRQWRKTGEETEATRLTRLMEQWSQRTGLAGLHLLDHEGRLLLTSGASRPTLLPSAPLSQDQEDEIQLSGPYMDTDGQAKLNLVTTLAGVEESPPRLLLQIPWSPWLYATLQNWPIASDSGETLLFRRDGDEVQFLNQLRHKEDSAFSLRLSLTQKELLAVQTLIQSNSWKEPLTGLDYRQVPVIGIAHPIAGTDWFLIAKMDQAELYKTLFKDSTWVLIAGLLALLATRSTFTLLMQQEQLERLNALQLLADIADSSEDAIFAKDKEGRYILFNQAASRFVGKPVAEVLGRDDRALFPADQAEMLLAIHHQILAKGRHHRQEEILDTPDGQKIFQAAKGVLRDTHGQVVGTFGISRDITAIKATQRSLQASENRFHDIVNASVDWVWEVDNQGRYTYASESVEKMLGYGVAELLGRTPFDFMPPEEALRVQTTFATILREKRPFRDLYNIHRHKDGSLRHMLSNGMPILDEGGQVVGYRGLDRDITSQKQDELALRASEAQFRTLFDTTSVGFCIHDPVNGAILDANRQAIQFFGYNTLDEFKQNNFWLEPPYSFRDALDLIHKTMREGEQHVTWKCRHARSGNVFWLNVALTPITLNGVDRLLAVALDITARKEAEAALRREKNTQESLAQLGQDFLALRMVEIEETAQRVLQASLHVTHSPYGFVAEMDPKTGWLISRALTKNAFPPWAAEDQPLLFKERRGLWGWVADEGRSLLTNNPLHSPFASGVPDGHVPIERFLAVPVISGGRITGMIAVANSPQDYGEHHRIALERVADLFAINLERVQLERQVRHMQRLEAIGTLSAGIAHDFNNILGIILGFADLGRDKLPPEDRVYHYLTEIQQAVAGGKQLVEQLLTFSRQGESRRRPLVLNVLVQEVVTFLRATFPSSIEMVCHLGEEDLVVAGDTTQLHQLLINLCTNARQAMPDDQGQITLHLDKKIIHQQEGKLASLPAGAYALLQVQDTGSGIASEVLDHIFDPFFTTKEVGQGTGLGLAVSHGIVLNHGGRILVESRTGTGSVFQIYLPLMEQDLLKTAPHQILNREK